MIRPTTILALIILSLSAFGLFEVKYQVQDLRKDLQEVNRQLQQEKEAIHILKAEWAYLNNPERVKRLAELHLAMEPIPIAQVRDATDASRLAFAEPEPKALPAKPKEPVIAKPVVPSVPKKLIAEQERKIVKMVKEVGVQPASVRSLGTIRIGDRKM